MQKRLPKTVGTTKVDGDAMAARELWLPFVAVRALFRIKLFWRHTEDIVALDAHPVEYLGRGRIARFVGHRSGRRLAVAHGWILTRRERMTGPDILNLAPGISWQLTGQERKCVEKWPTVLIDFTAGIDRPGNRPESPAKESIEPSEECSRVWLALALMAGGGSTSGTYG
jgi:hypothetical protein